MVSNDNMLALITLQTGSFTKPITNTVVVEFVVVHFLSPCVQIKDYLQVGSPNLQIGAV